MSASIALLTAERTISMFWQAYLKLMPACTDAHRLDARSSSAVGMVIFIELREGHVRSSQSTWVRSISRSR